MVIALAGRRVDDSVAAIKRFPPEKAVVVKQRIREFLQSHDARALVCAAACSEKVAMMQPSDFGDLYHRPALRWLLRSRLRRILTLIECEFSAVAR